MISNFRTNKTSFPVGWLKTSLVADLPEFSIPSSDITLDSNPLAMVMTMKPIAIPMTERTDSPNNSPRPGLKRFMRVMSVTYSGSLTNYRESSSRKTYLINGADDDVRSDGDLDSRDLYNNCLDRSGSSLGPEVQGSGGLEWVGGHVQDDRYHR